MSSLQPTFEPSQHELLRVSLARVFDRWDYLLRSLRPTHLFFAVETDQQLRVRSIPNNLQMRSAFEILSRVYNRRCKFYVKLDPAIAVLRAAHYIIWRWREIGVGVIWVRDNNIKMSTLPVIQLQSKRSRAEYLRFPTVGEEGGLRQSLEQQTQQAVSHHNYLYIDFQAGGNCGITEIEFFSYSRFRVQERRRNR